MLNTAQHNCGRAAAALRTAAAAKKKMEFITLPGTELKVSRICLGTMQFSNSWEWPCDQATATAVVEAALGAGVRRVQHMHNMIASLFMQPPAAWHTIITPSHHYSYHRTHKECNSASAPPGKFLRHGPRVPG
jgi:hypothetical protein